jgi:hypothetical protein
LNNAAFLLKETQKPPEFRQICQTKINLCKIGQIRQKSARNWEPAKNKKFPPDNFQIRQNCPNLAEKTAIWQRWPHGQETKKRAPLSVARFGKISPFGGKTTFMWEFFSGLYVVNGEYWAASLFCTW